MNWSRESFKIANPLQILLFGSAARGDMKAGSDIDVLVVVPEGTHRRRTAQEIYARVRGIGAPFDVIVVTPSVLAQNKDNVGLIYRRILEEGRQIYAA